MCEKVIEVRRRNNRVISLAEFLSTVLRMVGAYVP